MLYLTKVWIRDGDIVLLSLREFQDDVADIIHKYYQGEARSLVHLKEIPESGNVSSRGIIRCRFIELLPSLVSSLPCLYTFWHAIRYKTTCI